MLSLIWKLAKTPKISYLTAILLSTVSLSKVFIHTIFRITMSNPYEQTLVRGRAIFLKKRLFWPFGANLGAARPH